jgi:nicotinate-nucleotide adenylyltransferase
MRIGIFGGSFNPVHNMHKNISLELINKSYLDMVIYVPTGDNYNKKDLISFKDRLNMLKLMVLEDNKLIVSDIGNSNDYQYTYQVLDYFKNIYNADIYFICGSDNLSLFDTWMEYKYILENYKLLVIKRNNDNIDDILNEYNEYIRNIIVSDIEEVKLSSSMIRNEIDNALEYLDPNVYAYIKKNNLYRKR